MPLDQRKPLTLALTPAEEARVLAGLDRFVALVRDVAKIKPGDGDDTPQLADKLVAWWRSRPEKDPARPAVEDLVWAVGCAAGDLLYHVLEVRWRMLTDSTGARSGHPCLLGERGKEWIVLAPVGDLAERIASGEEDPVSTYLDELYDEDLVRGFIAEGE